MQALTLGIDINITYYVWKEVHCLYQPFWVMQSAMQEE